MPSINEEFLKKLKDDYKQYKCFIETGTLSGDTIFEMEKYFDKLYTIELSEHYYNSTKSRYNGNKIEFIFGDSSDELETLLPNIEEKAIFFLDGHWSSGDTARSEKNDCPLNEEINHINKLFKHEGIIIIDDYRLFGLCKESGLNEDWSKINKDNILRILGNRVKDVYHLESYLYKDDRLIIHIGAYSKPNVFVNIMGGLGNQMFQIASAYSYAKQNDGNLKILKINKNGNGYRKLYWNSLFKRFEPYLFESIKGITIEEFIENFVKDVDVWREDYPTMYKPITPLINDKFLTGHLQSSKYFGDDKMKQEIKELFRPNSSTIDIVKDLYDYLFEDSVKDRVVVLHQRATDYLNYPEFHNPLNAEYYKKSINLMLKKISNPIFVLAGDDISFWEKIRNDIPEIYEHQYVYVNENDILTFVLLQQFKNFIMSNSTFIWWCVWLSDSKNVIAPSKWFGPDGPELYSDIYEPTWEII